MDIAIRKAVCVSVQYLFSHKHHTVRWCVCAHTGVSVGRCVPLLCTYSPECVCVCVHVCVWGGSF